MTESFSSTKEHVPYAGRLFFDLLNEPDGFDMLWSKPSIHPNSGAFLAVPPWGALYTEAADALLQQEPQLLFLVEGTGQKNQPGTSYGTPFDLTQDLFRNLPFERKLAQAKVQAGMYLRFALHTCVLTMFV